MCAHFKARRTSHPAKPPTPRPAHRQHSPVELSREPMTPLPRSWAPQDRAERLYNPPLFPPTPLHLSGPASTRRSIPCLSTRCVSGPGPIPALFAPPSSPAELHGGGSLEPASAAAAAFLAAFLAALARSNSRVRAGTILGSRRTRGGHAAPPPTRRGPPTAPRRRHLHHIHSAPLSHHSHLPPHPFPSPRPHPPTAPGASRHPIPSTSVQPRARPCGGPFVLW